MDRSTIEEILNDIILTRSHYGAACDHLRDFTHKQCETCELVFDHVHIYTGLEHIAKLLGLEITEEYKNDERTDYTLVYKGVKFLQIGHDKY